MPPTALPAELGIEAGGTARVTPPLRTARPLPRRSEPPPPAHVIVPTTTDAASAASKPVPAKTIHVMRIVAIGKPDAQPSPLKDGAVVEELTAEPDLDETTPPLVHVETEVVEPAGSPVDELADAVPDATELDDADLAPDSQDPVPQGAGAMELGRAEGLVIPPDFPPSEPSSVPVQPPVSAEGRAPTTPTPPPPPRRPSPPRKPESNRPRARRTLKRPWWEDIFGEDFSRAIPRLSEKQISREVDFIEESLGVAKGGVVLDLGCGSGHHAVDLASRGYGVVGYDLSVYQLALAADVAQERDQKINFLQGDMREMAFDAMFDGIYCWNTSFGYFEEEKNQAVAERIFRALKPGGMFLIDVANRDFAATYSPSQLWYEGDSCVCMDDMSVDFITSRLRVKRSVIFDDGRSRECTYSVRLYSLHELGKLLHDVGFRVTEASGNTATPGVFFGEVSPRLIVLAQKP
jgi:SAM-dependent methyltransferase